MFSKDETGCITADEMKFVLSQVRSDEHCGENIDKMHEHEMNLVYWPDYNLITMMI